MVQVINLINDAINTCDNLMSLYDNYLINAMRLESLFVDTNILNITVDDIDDLQNLLKLKNEEMNERELYFFTKISECDDDEKVIFKIVGYDEEQKEIIKKYHNKIISIKENCINTISGEKKKISQYKNLLPKFNGSGLEIIDENDILLIRQLLCDKNVSDVEQYEIFKNIILINMKIYNNYAIDNENNVETDNDNIVTIESLTTTNLSRDDLIALFKKYNLDFLAMNEDFQNKLIKYGDLDKFDEILQCILNNSLKFIVEKGLWEILYKILLLSNVDMLLNVIDICKNNNIESFMEREPSILFPPVREIANMKKRIPTSGSSTYCVSGSYTNFVKNVQFLSEHGISLSDIPNERYKKFLIRNNALVKKSLEVLNLYEIDPFQDRQGQDFLSVFLASPSDIMKISDMAIESGCLPYYKRYLSKYNSNFDIRKVKLWNKKYKNDPNYQFCYPFHSDGKMNGDFKNATSILGENVADMFSMYGAVTPRVADMEVYEQIICSSDNDKITELSLNDSVIRELDSKYLMRGTDLIYNFNGVIISRKKVLRFYETLIRDPNIVVDKSMLTYVVTVNSMLDVSEYNRIDEALSRVRTLRRYVYDR